MVSSKMPDEDAEISLHLLETPLPVPRGAFAVSKSCGTSAHDCLHPDDDALGEVVVAEDVVHAFARGTVGSLRKGALACNLFLENLG